MKLAFHPYRLVPRFYHGPFVGRPFREGALLRIEFSDGKLGYSDIHPWGEFGDLTIAGQIAGIASDAPTPLLRRAFAYAELDANARAEGKNLLDLPHLPESHFLIVSPPDKETAEAIIRGGFSRIKLKAGKDLDSLVSQLAYWDAELPSQIKWRLDFNGVLDSGLFTRFLHLTERFHGRIDFIEDPFFAVEDWKALPSALPFALARDRSPDDAGRATVRILKPAVEDPEALLSDSRRIVVTSYLNHPLGQVAAAYSAVCLDSAAPLNRVNEIDGLLSHLVYEKTAFSEYLASDSATFRPVAGTGFGFDELLEKLEWTSIV